MNRRNMFLGLVSVGFIVLASCANPVGGDGPGTGPDYKPANYFVVANVYPDQDNVPSGSTAFNVVVQIQDMTKSDYGDASSAVVKVNNVTVARSASSKFIFSKTNFASLSTGDSVTISIDFSGTGSISKTLTVPESVTNFTVTPALPNSGAANTATTSYEMSWISSGADTYSPSYQLYSAASGNNLIRGIGYYTTSQTQTFSGSDLEDDSGNLAPYLSLGLLSYSKLALSGFWSSSAFEVAGVTRVVKSNRN